MIGHLSFGVADLPRATRFYDAALSALGYECVWTRDHGAVYGHPGETDRLALYQRPDALAPGPGFHLAFDAPSRDAVDRFHAAALAAGGTDDGVPGLRPQYGLTYYAAFVIDPEGYRLEAVHQ